MIFLDMDNCPFRYEPSSKELAFPMYTGICVEFSRNERRPIFSRDNMTKIVGYSEYINGFMFFGKIAFFITMGRSVIYNCNSYAYDFS